MDSSLQRVFQAERHARKLLEEAESRAKQIEADARSQGAELVRAAENARREALAEVRGEAEKTAASRRTELMAALDREETTWRERFESIRESLTDRVMSAVLGLEDGR